MAYQMLMEALRGPQSTFPVLRGNTDLAAPRTNKKKGAEKLPPFARYLADLKNDLRADLNVAALIIGPRNSAFNGSFSCLHCRRAREISIANDNVLIVMVQYIVELATQLEANSLGDLDLLVHTKIQHPVTWTMEGILSNTRIDRAYTAGIADRVIGTLSIKSGKRIGGISRKGYVVIQIRGACNRFRTSSVWQIRRSFHSGAAKACV